MREFDRFFPDWKTQVGSAIFYSNREGNVNKKGKQFTAYTLPTIDYVVKVPLNERWLNGYRLVEELAPEHSVPFTIAEGLKINVNRFKSTIPEAIVQLKVSDLVAEVETIIKTNDIDRFRQIAKGQMEADRKLFSAGLFVPDPSYVNFGIDKQSLVNTFDLGSARTTFEDDEEYSNLARARGYTHYSTYLFLKTIEDGLGIPPDEKNKPSDLYRDFMHLPPLHPKALTLDDSIRGQQGNNWSPTLSKFFAEICHQEFVDSSPNGAPHELNHEFLINLPSSALKAGLTNF